MLASMRQQRRAGGVNSPPTWVTSSPLADGGWEDAYLQTLVAVDADAPITYGLTTGALPPGVTLDGLTGVVSGTPSPDPDAPAWINPAGSLGTTTQGASFSVDFDATGVSMFSIASGLVPWGLSLNVATGILSGTLAIIGGAEDPPGPAPIWTTAAGTLGTFNEQVAVSVSIAATPSTAPVSYAVSSGGLPWGLLLDAATGAITGTTAEVGGGVTPDPVSPITWTAPASANLGSFAVGASVSIAQTVTPVTGAFSVVSGVMPWGLSMSRGTGLISGTVGASNAAGTYNFTVACAALVDSAFGYRTYTITIT